MTQPSERYLVMQNLSFHYQKLKNIQPSRIMEKQFNTIDKKRIIQRSIGEKRRSIEVDKNNYYLFRNLLSISLRNDTTFDRGEKLDKNKGKRKTYKKQKQQKKDVFKVENKQEERTEGNRLMLNKLITIEPTVGTRQNWKQQFKKHKYHSKRLRKSKDISKSRAGIQLQDKLATLQKSVLQPIYKPSNNRMRCLTANNRSQRKTRQRSSQCSQLCDRYKQYNSEQENIQQIKQKYLIELF